VTERDGEPGGAGEAEAPEEAAAEAVAAPAARAESAPDERADTAPGARAESAPDERADTAPVARAESAPGARAGTASEVRADTAPGARADSVTGSGTDHGSGIRDPSSFTRRFRITTAFRLPTFDTQAPVPKLRLRLRTKLVVAMVFAALVPVLIVALLATSVILSSLEAGLREDSERQLTVGLSLVLRAVERLGDECTRLSESDELATALKRARHEPDAVEPVLQLVAPPTAPGSARSALEAWISREGSHAPSARLQILDPNGAIIWDWPLGGPFARFKDIGVTPDDPVVAAGRELTRGVSLVVVGDTLVMRAVSPVLDASLELRRPGV